MDQMRKRKLNRKRGFDYASANVYFITACVHGKNPSLGKITDGKMHLSPLGEIALAQWEWLLHQYPYLRSHAFIIMPDHMHALIEIVLPELQPTNEIANHLRTGRDLSVPKIKSISELIGAYKSTTSKKIHLAGYPDFRWHRSFHDSIIRNEDACARIIRYIENNPKNWGKSTKSNKGK